MKQTLCACRTFFKQETVLCVALALALLSCFFVPPDMHYLDYIDFRTLALLFSLIAVMAGFREQGVFFSLGKRLLSKTGSMQQVLFVLVFLCFFGSMLITNDVALLTFVPFTFTVFNLFGSEIRKAWVVPVVCMQTIAANLGSMFTPIGNPQNLYLYAKSSLSLTAFLRLMLPYTLLSLLLLTVWILVLCRVKPHHNVKRMRLATKAGAVANPQKILLHTILFLLSLLSVAHLLPYPLLLGSVLLSVCIFDRSILAKLDYALLLTFVGFFVFIGNLGRVDAFSTWLGSILSSREVPVAVLASQLTSNVPAALLLSGFTNQLPDLIIGTNLGGLGTLIASMASLISFRQIANEESAQKKTYFILFTISNIAFLAILMGAWWVLAQL